MSFLSVIVPIYNEEKYIAQCIDSILAQDFPHENLEVLLVDGMSNDRTRDILKPYLQQYPYISLLDNHKRIAPVAMNIGIDRAKGDIIMRLDAHAKYDCNYFRVLVSELERLNADNVGCVCKTDVVTKTPKTLSIREVLANKFGVGNSTFRTGVENVKEVDTVPFGCWRKSVFEKYGKYDERLVRNQDIELNKRIIRGGGHIFIVPNTSCTYYARETFSALAKNNYNNGMWNIKTVNYTRQLSSLSFRHFVPMMFILSMVIPLFLSVIYWPIGLLSLASLLAYTGLFFLISVQISKEKGLPFIYLFYSFIVLHISYGFGSIMGLLKTSFLLKK